MILWDRNFGSSALHAYRFLPSGRSYLLTTATMGITACTGTLFELSGVYGTVSTPARTLGLVRKSFNWMADGIFQSAIGVRMSFFSLLLFLILLEE